VENRAVRVYDGRTAGDASVEISTK